MLATFRSVLIGVLALTVGLSPILAGAESAEVEQLRSQINNHTEQIANLEKEIAQYQKSLNATAKQASTLKNELNILDTERKKLAAEIKLTESKISQTNLRIKQLAIDIGNKDDSIKDHQAALSESLRIIRNVENESLTEIMLAQDSLASFVANQDRYLSLQGKVNSEIASLRDLKTELSDTKAATEVEQKKLISLNNDLGDQKKLADQNRKAKNDLLTQTKNTEANYTRLIADRQAKKEAFERELFLFESQLKIAIDKSLLPGRGTSALAWPLANVFITQMFGRTVDSVRLYASGTHNGVDFRASVGTPVMAAASGVVWATGDTDAQPGCYSYGKWVLVKHNNGLSTLYGHLSLIKVSPNQPISTGQLVGYSGNTGYTTGPHLHLTVYATQGVRVQKYESSKFCKNVVVPIADINAYLDPLDYLPS